MREIKNGHSPRPLSQADVTVTVMTVRKKKKKAKAKMASLSGYHLSLSF